MAKLDGKKLRGLYPRILTIGALVGLIASFWQVVERIHMLKDPLAALSCNLNPVVDCGGVLSHRLAALFGFPNALIGIVMFSILFVFGLAMLAKVEAKQWFWKVFAVVSLVLILFSVWFFGTSLYVIGKVCIFCIFIWTVSVPIFVYGLDWLADKKLLPKSVQNSGALTFVRKYSTETVVGVYATGILLYLYRFRDFYFQ